MRLVNETWHIKAPVKYVYEYFTSIELFKKEFIKYLKKEDRKHQQHRVSISYNSTAPFAVGNEIKIIGKHPLYKLVIIDNEPERSLDFRVVPLSMRFQKWGEATLTCRFTGMNNQTTVTTRLESHSTPNWLWWIFIKIIVWILLFRTKSDTMRVIQKIEDSARCEVNHE